MSYPVRAIIFDLDGVLIDSNPAIEVFWKNWADQEQISLTEPMVREWIHGRKVGDTLTGIFGHLSDAKKERIRESAYVFDQQMQPTGITGVHAFTEAIGRLGIPAGIVTSSHHTRMYDMLVGIGIENQFTHFVTAHDVTKGKPDPEPYLTMSHKMGIPAAECLVFEDAISGIRSAVSAGMHTIGIGQEQPDHPLQREGAKDVIPGFDFIRIHQRTFTTPNGVAFTVTG